MQRPLTAIAAGTAGLLVLAACSSSNHMTSSASMSGMSMTAASGSAQASSGSGIPAAGAHNQADVSFATDMVPHHRQAIEMADMALTRATNPEVKALARAIKSAQDPEITEMSGWLTTWHQPVPSSAAGGMGGMGHTGKGMMSDADMATLNKASGATFDRMWVSMMIQHHRGAVTMATTEKASGQNPDSKALARSIITSQTAQISQLTSLLAKLPK